MSKAFDLASGVTAAGISLEVPPLFERLETNLANKTAKRWGLTPKAARGYALLSLWGEHYGYPRLDIVSGRRTAERQRWLIDRWEKSDPRTRGARPAERSRHLTGNAFDLELAPWLSVYGVWAPLAGLTWGGTFQGNYDPNHFHVIDAPGGEL